MDLAFTTDQLALKASTIELASKELNRNLCERAYLLGQMRATVLASIRRVSQCCHEWKRWHAREHRAFESRTRPAG